MCSAICNIFAKPAKPLLRKTQPSARKVWPPLAAIPYTCGPRGVFPDAHVAGEKIRFHPQRNTIHLLMEAGTPLVPGKTRREIFQTPIAIFRRARIITADNQIFVFRAGCKSPPEVKSSSGAPHEPVRFRYRQYSLDGRRREGKLLCDTTVRRIGCWKGDFL